MWKAVGIGILALVGFLGFNFAMTSLGYWQKGFFGAWDEQIRYDIQKESQAHIDGLRRNLDQMMIQHMTADAAGKAGIAAAARQQYAQTDLSNFSAAQLDWLRTVAGIY